MGATSPWGAIALCAHNAVLREALRAQLSQCSFCADLQRCRYQMRLHAVSSYKKRLLFDISEFISLCFVVSTFSAIHAI